MKIIKFLIEDFKSDIKFIKQIMSGKAKINDAQLKSLTTGWNTFIQDNWIFLLIVTLAFFSGYFFASQHYQNVCNQFILNNYVTENIQNYSSQVFNWTS